MELIWLSYIVIEHDRDKIAGKANFLKNFIKTGE